MLEGHEAIAPPLTTHSTRMTVGNRWHAFCLFTQKPSGHCASLELPNSSRKTNLHISTYPPGIFLSQVQIQLLHNFLFHPDWQYSVLLLQVCLSSDFLQKITAFPNILCWGSVAVWVGSSAWFLCGGGRLCGGILVVWLWCILKESCCLFQSCWL